MSLFVAVVALLASVASVYFQFFRIRGPLVTLLNQDEAQRAMVRPFEGLPQVIQQQFARYEEKCPGYALVRLMYANSGDRPGFAKRVQLACDGPDQAACDGIKASYYSHVLIPPYSLVAQDLVLRNIPILDTAQTIKLNIHLELGGPHPQHGWYEYKGQTSCDIDVVLSPGALRATS